MGVHGVPPACQPPTTAPSQHRASMDVAGCADVGCAGAMCTAGWWKLPRAGGARRGASAPLKRAALRPCLSQLARASAPARPRWEAWLTPVPEKVNWYSASVVFVFAVDSTAGTHLAWDLHGSVSAFQLGSTVRPRARPPRRPSPPLVARGHFPVRSSNPVPGPVRDMSRNIR